MGRSKKNWDRLVDERGNYGIDIINGLFPGSDGNSIKGQKGQKGKQGDQGYKGMQGPQGQKGQQGNAGVDGLKGDKGVPGADSTIAGAKGDQGEKGNKGDEAVAPVLQFKGAVDFVSVLPIDGSQAVGDTYFVGEKNAYYAWDGAQWVEVGNAIKGEKGQKGIKGEGEKGAEGVQGEKGETGDTGLTGPAGGDGADGKDAYEVAQDDGFTGTKTEWLESLKGQKGEIGDTSGIPIFDDTKYYDKDAIDQLIEGHEVPERAFDYYFSSENPDNELKSADFSLANQNDHLYDLGPVIVESGVSPNLAPPFTSSTDMLVLNYALRDPLGSRSTQYEVMQFVYGRSGNENKFEGFVRRAQPGLNKFTDWRPCVFNDGLYYTKVEIDKIVNDAAALPYKILPVPGDEFHEAKLELRELGGTNDSFVTFRGEGGIDIQRKDGKIVVDGSALNGITYIGPIAPEDDPEVKQPVAELGEFFIYSRAGTAWNGTDVGAGDWVIYSGPGIPEWKLIFVGGENGVLSIDVDGALTKTGTETHPVIGLDPDLYVEADSMPDRLQPYSTWDDIIKLSALRRLGTLSDVEAGEDLMGPGGSYSEYLDSEPAAPMTGGQYYTDVQEQEIYIAQNDQYFRAVADMFDDIVLDATEVRVYAPDLSFDLRSKILEKQFNGKDYRFKFDNPEVPRTVREKKGTFLINLSYGYETPDGSYLQYNLTTNKWKPSVNDWLSQAVADDRYVAAEGGDTRLNADKFEINADVVEVRNLAGDGGTDFRVFDNLTVAGQGSFVANVGEFQASVHVGTAVSPFLGATPNAVVTVARLQLALDNLDLAGAGGGGGGGGGSIDLTGENLTLKNSIEFKDDTTPYAQLRAVGRSDKSFMFALQNGATASDVKTVLTITKDRINANGLRVINIADAQSPSDALSLQSAQAKFIGKSNSSDVAITAPAFRVTTPSFEVFDNNKPLIKTVGSRVELSSPRSGHEKSDTNFADNELVPTWRLESELSTLETSLTAAIDAKPGEAAKNGKQYARKDGAWSEVIIPDPDLSNYVQEAPKDFKEYGRKNGAWVALTSTTSVGSLPASPNRGTIYLTSGNVLAIGL